MPELEVTDTKLRKAIITGVGRGALFELELTGANESNNALIPAGQDQRSPAVCVSWVGVLDRSHLRQSCSQDHGCSPLSGCFVGEHCSSAAVCFKALLCECIVPWGGSQQTIAAPFLTHNMCVTHDSQHVTHHSQHVTHCRDPITHHTPVSVPQALTPWP
jgi:hypothetical protein